MAKNIRRKKAKASPGARRANPAEGASDVFELFHGVPSQKVLEYTSRFHIHENLAGLGRLIELVFITPGSRPRMVTLEEGDLGAQAWLCASEDAKSLYIIGPVVIDLEQLGYRPEVDVKDAVELGRLTNVVYKTKKEMNNLDLLEYDHTLGKRERWQKREGVGPEMNKEVAACPLLIYHTREDRLSVAGGQYLVMDVGITN